MTAAVIDLEMICPGITSKIQDYAGGNTAIFLATDDGFSLYVLLEAEDGWEWRDIEEALKKGASTAPSLSVVKPIKGGKDDT